MALSKLGADAMLLNTAFAGPQLTEVVKREKPRAIVYDAEFAELLSDALHRRLAMLTASTMVLRRRFDPRTCCENVFPQEVEETLAEHPKVVEAAVVGVDDEKWGQALKAFVVTKGSVDEKSLKRHVKDNLAGYKVPQALEFIDELPRNAAGKVLKKELDEDDDD